MVSLNGPRVQFWRFAGKYSLRSLRRHKRRTTLTVATVVFAAAVAIVATRYTSAIMTLWADGACDTGLGHIQIHKNGYWQKQEGIQKELTLRAGAPLEEVVRGVPGYESSVRRLRFEGIISSGRKTVYFMGMGADPADEGRVSARLFGPRDEGKFLDESDPKGVVLGRGLASSLKVGLGDNVTLLVPTAMGTVDARDFRVRGIVTVPIPSFSQRIIYVPLSEVQKLVKLPDAYSELVVRLKSSGSAAAAQKYLREKLSAEPVEVRTWYEVEPTIRNIEHIFDAVIGVISGLLFVSAALSVLNIIMILVAERTVEIGTLMAIGAKSWDIQALFSLEAGIIGAAGGGIGVALANGIVLAMDLIGVPFKSPFSAEIMDLHPHNHIGFNVVVFCVAVLVCGLAAWRPARRAAMIEPVKAFRGQLT